MKLKPRLTPKTVDLLYGVLTICLTLPAHALPAAQLRAGNNSDTNEQVSDLVVKVKAGNGASFSSSPARTYSAPQQTYRAAPAPVAPPRQVYTPPVQYTAPVQRAPLPAQRAAAPVRATTTYPVRTMSVPLTRDSSAFPISAPAPALASAPAPAPARAAAPAPAPVPAPKASGGFFSRFFGGSKPAAAAAVTTGIIHTNSKQENVSFLPKNDQITNIVPVAGGLYEGTAPNGTRVRFRDVNGTRTFVAAQSVDPQSGANVTRKFNRAGAMKVLKVAFKGGRALWTHFHKNGARQKVLVDTVGTRIVSNVGRGGYVERNLTDNGKQFLARTYFNSATQRSFATRYLVDANGYPLYTPHYRFNENFYSGIIWGSLWQPLVYGYNSGWSWNYNANLLAPSGPSAGYFAAAPIYSSPLEWLTDFVIADTLSDATFSPADGNTAQDQTASSDINMQIKLAAEQAQFTSSLKAQLSAQIRQEVLAQQNGNSVPLKFPLHNPKALFLNTELLELTLNDQGDECTLDAGDLLRLTSPIDSYANLETVVPVQVVSARSTTTACSPGSSSFVTIGQLLEMKNRFAARIETGFKALSDQQGINGIPKYSDEAPASLFEDATQAEDIQQLQELQNSNSQN